MTRHLKSILFAALLAFALPFTAGAAQTYDLYSQFSKPDNRYRPFVRWWWNGDRVDAEELVRELHLLKEAGIAGVEINPISFPGKEAHAVGHKAKARTLIPQSI